jgi:hypothetical protein
VRGFCSMVTILQRTKVRHMLIAMFINSMLAQKTSRSKHWPWIDCHGAGVAHWKAVANVDALRSPLVDSVPVYEVFLLTQTRGSSTPLSPAAVANVSDLAPASTQTQHPLHLPEISSQGRESQKHIVSSSMLVTCHKDAHIHACLFIFRDVLVTQSLYMLSKSCRYLLRDRHAICSEY